MGHDRGRRRVVRRRRGGRGVARLVATLVALVPLALIAPGPAAAAAKEVSAHSGDVEATLSYSADRASFGYKAGKLKIVRRGAVLFDAVPRPAACGDLACGPAVRPRHSPLAVRDLDADGEPEVVYTAYTGGAHCCDVGQFFMLAADGGGYTSVSRNFGDPGFRLQDLTGDGRPEVVTADDSFAYRFTAYAFSVLPLSVLRFDHGRFRDITDSFPGRLRAEARRFWGYYRDLRNRRDDTPRGSIAAWAADQYRLGHRAHALRVLHREVSRGRLGHPNSGAKFIKHLDRFLRHRGYA